MIRRGNTIIVKWRILTNGEEMSLEGRDLKVFITSTATRHEVKDVVIEGNVIGFKWEGAEQRHAGRYDVTLYENYGKANQAVVDVCNAFTLVDKSCQAKGVVHNSNIDVEYVELTGNVQTILGASTSRVRVTFSPYGSDDEYDMGNISGDLFERFFDEVPESTWQDAQMYPYYAYGDMGDGENFSGIGEWGDAPEEEVNDGEVGA